MAINCPHCGEDLTKVGVIALVGFYNLPDENGFVPFESERSNMCDDTEGYICAHCSGSLGFTDDDSKEATRIVAKTCKRCGHPIEDERDPELRREYPYYCPNCDENMYSFETC